jgi:hypothetical protein
MYDDHIRQRNGEQKHQGQRGQHKPFRKDLLEFAALDVLRDKENARRGHADARAGIEQTQAPLRIGRDGLAHLGGNAGKERADSRETK